MRIFPPVMPIDVTSNSSKECWMGVFVRGGMWKRGLIAWFFFLPLSEAMAARELAESERDEALDALARTAVERDEALSSGHRADVPATVPGASAERDEGVLEMRFEDAPRAVSTEAPAASMLASERDEALERCAVLETELGSLHARVHDLLERLEEL